jgi:hypothetical protein
MAIDGAQTSHDIDRVVAVRRVIELDRHDRLYASSVCIPALRKHQCTGTLARRSDAGPKL